MLAKELIKAEDVVRAVAIKAAATTALSDATADYGALATTVGGKWKAGLDAAATKATANTAWELAKTHRDAALGEKDKAIERRTAL